MSKLMQKEHDPGLEMIFTILWSFKYLIISITALFAISSIYFSLQMPDKYRSSALIVVIDPSKDSGSSMLSRFGGLASMAGISLPSSSGGDKALLSVATIISRDFFNKLIEDNDILPQLYAAKNYNKNTRKLTYADSYNFETESWNKSNKNITLRPTNQEAYAFYRGILNIDIEDKSGYMTISITHVSPNFANELIRLIVTEVNSITRQNDLNESETALVYLKSLMGKVPFIEIKDSLSNLIEAQLETQMLANIRMDDYLLKYIDQPFSPEKKYSPRRSLIVVMSSLLGALLGILFALYLGLKRKKYV
jgi:LPS O-antigen subunit length determinant protein (WzzB/FepE family)